MISIITQFIKFQYQSMLFGIFGFFWQLQFANIAFTVVNILPRMKQADAKFFLNPFIPIVLFWTPLKTTKNQRFSDALRWYEKQTGKNWEEMG